MKLEKAKQKLWATAKINTLSKVECDHLIDEIYDDFKSRTCKHCRYLNRTKQNVLLCDINNISNGTDYGALSVDEDFGCNKFEEK